jgi:hypothetical protein
MRSSNPDEAAARLERDTAAQAVRRADMRSSTSEQICQEYGNYFGEICTSNNNYEPREKAPIEIRRKFESHPKIARQVFWEQDGTDEYPNFPPNGQATIEDIEKMGDKLKDMIVTPQKKGELHKKYMLNFKIEKDVIDDKDETDPYIPLCTCAACGERDFSNIIKTANMAMSELNLLKMTALKKEEYLNLEFE